MRKFLVYTTSFALLLVILAVPLELFLRNIPNPYKYKYQWMAENANDVETLVLGNSHAYLGIRPEYLDGKSFNLANYAQRISEDYFLLNYSASKYRKLHTVILPISYVSLFLNGLGSGEKDYRSKYYKIYMNYDEISDFSRYNFELGAEPVTAKTKFWNWLNGQLEKYDKYGWGMDSDISKKDITLWDSKANIKDAAKRHTVSDWEALPKNCEVLTEMAEWCKVRNIRLVFITIPTWCEYNDQLDERQLAKMHEVIHNFQSKYGITYLDYQKDNRFGPDDFFDGDHLSNIGAEKFSKILNEDIKKIP